MKSICEHIHCVIYSLNDKICGGYFCKYHAPVHKNIQKNIALNKNEDLEMELLFRLLSITTRKIADHGHLFKACSLIKKKIDKINLNKQFLITWKTEYLFNKLKENIKINVNCGFIVAQNNNNINELLFIIHLYNEIKNFIF